MPIFWETPPLPRHTKYPKKVKKHIYADQNVLFIRCMIILGAHDINKK